MTMRALLVAVALWGAIPFVPPAVAEATASCQSGQAGPYATLALLKKKPGVSDGDFSAYWRDIHGMLATRIPGFWTYRQYHLDGELQSLRRLPDNYGGELERLDGFADVSFCSTEDIAGLAASPVSELIKQDERNVFAASYLYSAGAGDSLTLQRQRPFADTAQNEQGTALLMLLARGANESRDSFRADLERSLSRLTAQCADLQRLRVNYFQPYDASAWPAPDVNHDPPQQMDAAVELQFSGLDSGQRCLGSGPAFAVLADGAARDRVQQVYLVASRYAMVVDGQITPLARRGLPAMELIQRLGATNQLSEAVLDALSGHSAR